MQSKLFGWIATTFSLIYKLPQIAHLCRTVSVSGINALSLYIQASSYIFLIIHGIILDDYPIIMMGVISLLQSIALIVLYHYCIHKNKVDQTDTVQFFLIYINENRI